MALLLPLPVTTPTSTEETTEPDRSCENKENTKSKVKPTIGLFWDIENCRIPAGKSVLSYVNLIRDKFCKDYCCDEFICVCAVETISERMCEELNNAQVTLAHVPAGAKNAADEKLRQKIRRFGEVFADRNAAAILITGDINFISDVTDLRHRYGVKVILIHNPHTNEQLKSVANETALHEDLLNETSDRVVKSGMQLQPQELVIMNLPLNVSEVTLRQKLSKLCDNCGGKVNYINRAKGVAYVSFGSVETCERAFIRLQNRDLFGCKIQVDLALRSSNVPGNYNSNTPGNSNNYNYDNSHAPGHFSNNSVFSNAKNTPPFQPTNSNKLDGTMVPPRNNNWVTESMAHQPTSVLANNSSFNAFCNSSYQTSSPGNTNTFPRTPRKGLSNSGGAGDRNMHTSPFRNLQNSASKKPIASVVATGQVTPQSKPIAVPLAAAPKVLIKDDDVSALMVTSRLDCNSFKDKLKHWLHKHLKQKNIPFKTEYSNTPNLKNCFIICCKSRNDLTIAKEVIVQFNTTSGGVLQLKPREIQYHTEPISEFRSKVEQLIDTTFTQLHTFFLSYWQKFGVLFKPSELNFLTDLIEISEDQSAEMKYVSRKVPTDVSIDVDEEEPMTFKYMEPLLKKTGNPVAQKEFDPYDQSNFTLLDVSDYDTGKRGTPGKPSFRDSSSVEEQSHGPNVHSNITEPGFSVGDDLNILFKCFTQVPTVKCKETSISNFVKFQTLSLCEFSEHVYELLSDHEGIIPLPMFLNFYSSKFGKLASDARIPFEQLLLSVEGVSTFYNDMKCVCFSSLDSNFKEYYCDVRAPMPLVASKTNEFINEVLRQLEMAKNQNYKITLSTFRKNYVVSKEREFNPGRYGFSNSRDLFLACRGYFTVLGVGANQTICYSRRLNVKRFGLFLATEMNLTSKASLETFLNSHQQLPCNPVNYGLCYHGDLCNREFMELAISTQQSQPTRFELSNESVRDITRFSHEVFIVMSSAPDQTLSFNEFYSSFHKTFNKRINTVDFGFTDLKELLLATELVWITDSPETSTKSIMMRPLIKLLCEIFNLLKKNNWSLPLRDISRNYERAFGTKLKCYRHGFPDLKKLIQSVPSFLKVVYKSSGLKGDLLVFLAPSFKEVTDKCVLLSPSADAVTTSSANWMGTSQNQNTREYYQDAPSAFMSPRNCVKPSPSKPVGSASIVKPTLRPMRSATGSFRSPNQHRNAFADCLQGPQMPSGEMGSQFKIPLPPKEFLKNNGM